VVRLLHGLNVSTNGCFLVVFPVEVDEDYEEDDEDEDADGGDHGGEDGGGLYGLSLVLRSRAGAVRCPPLDVVVYLAEAGGGVGEVTLVLVPPLPQPVGPVTAVPGGLAPHAPELSQAGQLDTLPAAPL